MPDLSKGSYYNNPQYNTPFEDPDVIAEWPSFAHPNIWPTEHLPELEDAFLAMGRAVVDVGKLVATQCDAYCHRESSSYPPTMLHDLICNTRNHKARLLNYFPKDSKIAPLDLQEPEQTAAPESTANASSAIPIAIGSATDVEGTSPSSASLGELFSRSRDRSHSLSSSFGGSLEGSVSMGGSLLSGSVDSSACRAPRPGPSSEPADPFSSWCGWHNDHGSLTGLVPAIYTDCDGQTMQGSSDPEAGLYVKARDGRTVRAKTANEGCLLFQIGETAQVHSGGLLQATPHAVRGTSATGVSRQAFAVFMEPQWDGMMNVPDGMAAELAQTSEAASTLPAGVPALADRWGTETCPFSACSFGTFTEVTLNAYH